jgi:hypothetical protein
VKRQVIVTKLDSNVNDATNKYSLALNHLNLDSNLEFSPLRSSSSSSFGANSANSGSAGARTETNYDQDILQMAHRTNAENSGSSTASQTGRRRMNSQQDGEAFRPDLVTGVTTLERAAQGKSGFHTTGVDLGVIGGRNNVDDEMRRQSSASGGATGSSRSSSSSSSSGGHQSGTHSSGSGYSYNSRDGTTTFNDNALGANDDDYEDDYEEVDDQDQSDSQSSGKQGGQSWSRTSSYSYSNKRPVSSVHDSGDSHFRHYQTKREAIYFPDKEICQSLSCVNVRCVVGPLLKDTEAFVALRTRVVASTLAKVS